MTDSLGTGTAFQSYVKEFSNLDKATQQAVLSSGLLSKAQKEQLISQMELSASTTTLTAEQIKERLATELNSEADAKALLAKSGLITEKELETGTTIEITTAKLNEAVANGALSASDAAVIAGALGISGANATATTSFGILTKAVWANVKAMGTWLVTTPAGWATLAIGAIGGLAIAYHNATLTIDEATDALEDSKSSYDSVSDEVSKLTDELNECRSRMKELEYMGSLRSIVEDDELEKLQDTNVALTRRLAILKEEQRLKAVDVAKDASNVMTTELESDYSKIYIGGTDERGQSVTPEEEMRLAINAYRKYAEEKAKIDAELLKDPENEELADESQKWQDKMDLASSRANEMAGYINQTEEAYKKVIDTGGTLTNTQMDLYNSSIALGDEYLAFVKEINGVNEAFESLDTTEKAQTLKDKYAKKTIALPNGQGSYTVDDKEISDWIDTLSDEDLKILGTINFSGEQTKDSMQDALNYAKNHTDNTNETGISTQTISQTITQLNTQLKPAFDSLKSAYNDIFTSDGFTLENVDLSMLDNIKSKIDELNKNEELNIQIDYSSFENLATVLTDSSSTAEEVQDAFNEFAGTVVDSLNPALSQTTGENYKLVQSLLESLGIVNSEAVMISSLGYSYEEYKAAKEECAEAGFDLANATESEINGFIDEQGGAENCGQALAILQLKKLLVNSTTINTMSDVSQILTLANAANISAKSLVALANAKAQFETAQANGDKQGMALAGRYINDLTSQVKDDILNFSPVEYSAPSGGSKSGGGSSKDTWKEAYDKELKELEHLHEMQLISDEEYYNQRIALNEKYFGEASGKHEKYLDEYRDNEEDIAQGLKKMWEDYWNDYKDGLDRLSSYAEKVFQKQIDALEKQKDKADDAYNKEIESIESAIKALEDKRDAEKEYWQNQIDAIQDEIDALQDANDERERAINLQKKMYELQRAMSQRSILQYSSEKGMHYVTNDKDITNARDEVEQAKFDITIANLQKQKDALEDKLDEITDKYDAQIEKLNLRKETVENNMDAENKRLQEQINLLEEQKEKWTEVAENIEFALLEREMMEKYGSDVTQKILSGDVEFLNAFISDYERATGVIQELDNATLTDIMNMVSQFGTSAENMGGISTQLADNLGTISGSADKLAESASKVDMTNVNTGLSDVSSTAQTASDQLSTATQKFNDLTNEINNYSIPPLDSTNFVSSLGIDGNGGVLGDLQTFVNKFKELCESIPTIWNDSLGVLVNGGGEAGGAEVRGYDSLFKPLLDAMTTTKTAIDTKLEEYKLAWQKFNTDLGTIIGVGNGSQTGAEGTDTGGGKQTGGKEGSDKKEKKAEADTSSIVGTITAGGEAVIQSFDEIWIPGFETFRDNISTICEQVVACMDEMAKKAIEAAIKTIEAVNAASEATGGSSYDIPDSLKDWAGVTYVRPYAEGTEKAKKGLAIVGEEKPEIIVDNNGNVLLAKQPSIMNMEGGETVYNGEATAKMINGKNIVPLTAENDPKMYDYIQKFNNYIGKAVAERPVVQRPSYVLGDETEDMKALRLDNQIMQEILQPISNVNKNVEMLASNISKINSNNTQQTIQFSTGDIIVQGVQNVDGFAKAVKTRFPNAMIQALNVTR